MDEQKIKSSAFIVLAILHCCSTSVTHISRPLVSFLPTLFHHHKSSGCTPKGVNHTNEYLQKKIEVDWKGLELMYVPTIELITVVVRFGILWAMLCYASITTITTSRDRIIAGCCLPFSHER